MEEQEEAPRYLLDCNIVSEIIKPEPSFNVITKFVEHTSDCAICAPVWQEMLFGAYRMQDGMNKKYLLDFIKDDIRENFKIISYTQKSAEIHAQIRAMLEKSGNPIQSSDTEISAIALANRMILVTRNVRHFEAIQKLTGLQVENWFEESTKSA